MSWGHPGLPKGLPIKAGSQAGEVHCTGEDNGRILSPPRCQRKPAPSSKAEGKPQGRGLRPPRVCGLSGWEGQGAL